MHPPSCYNEPTRSRRGPGIRMCWLLLSCTAVVAITTGITIHKRSVTTTHSTEAWSATAPRSQAKLVAILPFSVPDDVESALASTAIDEALPAFLTGAGITVLFTSTLVAIDAERIAQLHAHLLIAGSVYKRNDQLVAVLVATDAVGKAQFRVEQRSPGRDIPGLVDGLLRQLAPSLGSPREISPPRPQYMTRESYKTYLRASALAQTHRSPEELTTAISLFNAVLDSQPQLPCVQVGLAEAALRMYQATHNTLWLSSVSSGLTGAGSAQPQCIATQYRVAHILKATGQTISSLGLLKQLSGVLPSSDQLKRDLATTYIALGMYDAAVSEGVKAVAIDPMQWLNHEVLGESYMAGDNYSAAIKALTHVLAINSTSFSANHNLGAAYLHIGDFDRAIDPMRQALLQRPKAADTHSNLGTVYFYLGDLQASAAQYEIATALSPTSEEYAGNLATTYRLLHRTDKAHEVFLKALALARQDLAHNAGNIPQHEVHIALYEAQLGRFRRAYEMIDKARNLDPRSGELLSAQIVIHALAKDYTRATDSVSQMITQGYPLHLILANPTLKQLRGERSFVELIKRSPASLW